MSKYNNKKMIQKTDDDNKMTPKKIKEKRHCINDSQFNYLLNEIDKNESNYIKKFNLYLINSILYYTGIRINECLSLKKCHYQELFKNARFNLFCKKTKSYRVIYMPEDCKKIFLDRFYKTFKSDNVTQNIIINDTKSDTKSDTKNDQIIIENEDDFFNNIHELGICNIHKKPIAMRTAMLWMESYFKKLEEYDNKKNQKDLYGPIYSYHSYRVGYINRILKNNNHNLILTKDLVGHANVSSTEIYLRDMGLDKNDINNIMKNAFNY